MQSYSSTTPTYGTATGLSKPRSWGQAIQTYHQTPPLLLLSVCTRRQRQTAERRKTQNTKHTYCTPSREETHPSIQRGLAPSTHIEEALHCSPKCEHKSADVALSLCLSVPLSLSVCSTSASVLCLAVGAATRAVSCSVWPGSPGSRNRGYAYHFI